MNEVLIRNLPDKHDVNQATFLVEGTHRLKDLLRRLGLQSQVCPQGDWNAVKHIIRLSR